MPAKQPHGDTPTSELPQALWDELSRYYMDHIARLMVWIDTDKNLYRHYIIPMASESPVLRLAISAVAGLHWNATGLSQKISLPESIRDEAIMGITASVKGILEQTAQLTLKDAQWMLASMLVLSCCEMIKAGAEAADWHRRAARRLVGVINTMEWCKDRLISFLVNQLAIYDILSCTTSFDLSNVQEAILPVTSKESPLFSKILLLIHSITLDHRRYRQNKAASKVLLTLRMDIELARGETLMVTGTLGIQDPSERRDFVRLVDLYCKATYLYAHRVLNQHGITPERHILEDMFSVLDATEEPERICHNLVWPLFIMGTECHGDAERQGYITEQFEAIHRVTGFNHYQELVEFLLSVWAGESSDWQTKASERESMALRILAV
ncbi:Zn(2)-C6 fungal-type domain-containing protein [Fusarium falciforme]|uniref:Zn(2)-C6 fungal-type domain-containing protein n=1 Tax=Fusarium falciforme TaxID=195108 RepID=UPI0023014CD6|nr:Zn(2)-C6 fungal-type domain-containing protein [Fusarium falciforme]WAO91600.1 Zn(2)-C6 fungal-type domain-containing protein [Fusarium falciforme]